MSALPHLSHSDIRHLQLIWDYMFLRHDLPESADVISGLGCHDLGVADDVATAYGLSSTSNVLFTGNVGRMTKGMFERSEASIMRDRAIECGVPAEVILLEEKSTNTGENIMLSQRLLREKGLNPKSVVLVHKPYMLRRDYATFMKQWEGAKHVNLTCWAKKIECEEYILKSSNPSEEVAIIVGDLQRMKLYHKLDFQIEQAVPSDVWHAFDSLVKRGYDTQLVT